MKRQQWHLTDPKIKGLKEITFIRSVTSYMSLNTAQMSSFFHPFWTWLKIKCTDSFITHTSGAADSHMVIQSCNLAPLSSCHCLLQELCSAFEVKEELYRELQNKGRQLLAATPEGPDSNTEQDLANLKDKWEAVQGKVAERKVCRLGLWRGGQTDTALNDSRLQVPARGRWHTLELWLCIWKPLIPVWIMNGVRTGCWQGHTGCGYAVDHSRRVAVWVSVEQQRSCLPCCHENSRQVHKINNSA